MPTLEEALAMAEAMNVRSSNWTRLQQYELKSFYSDDDVPINIEGRAIGDLSENISTIGENNSQYISFIMDRYADGVDLSGMLIQVQYELEDGSGSTGRPVNAYASDEQIRFGWAIPDVITQKEQTIRIIVFCTGTLTDGQTYILKTRPVTYTTEYTLSTGGTIPKPDEDWYLQFVNVLNEKVVQAADSASVAIEASSRIEDIYSDVSASKDVVENLASIAQESATVARASEQNSKESEEKAKMYADNASAVSGIEIATKDRAGVMKGGDNSVAEDGALELIRTTTSRTLTDSYAGGLKINEIVGASEQGENPTFEHSQPIESVGDSGSLEIKINAKNMFNPESKAFTSLTVNKNNMVFSTSSNVTGTRLYYLPCKPKTKYSYSKTLGATVRLLSCPDIPVLNGKITVLNEKSGNSISITTGANDKYICIYPLFSTELDSITWDDVLKSIQVEEGNATDFEPYISSAVLIPLAEPLRKYDKVVEKDGFFEVLRGTKRVVFNGSENWVASGALAGRYGVVLDGKVNGACLCTVAVNGVNGSTVSGECFINQNGDFYINTDFGTVDEWKAHLSENPITVEYEVDTPVFEPFPTDVQIALYSLMSYKGINHIHVSGKIQPTVEIEHGTSPVGAYTVEALNTSKRNEIHVASLITLTNDLAARAVAGSEG